MLPFRKILRGGTSYLTSRKHPLPIWTHLWVTECCNLSCNYCYIVDNGSKDPTTEEVKSWVNHAQELGSAIIAFMGGEPTLRKDLPEIILEANKREMITYMTTNGKLLTYQKASLLAYCGLNVLELSLDGYNEIPGSKKTLNGDEHLLDLLEQVSKESGLAYKIHQVLSEEALDETPQLLELSERRRIPISFGMVDGPNTEKSKTDIKLRKTLSLILDRKKNGAQIVNPASYFIKALDSLYRPVRIDCDIGRYMIQVATDGSVFECSKLGTKRPMQFLNINTDYFRNDQHESEKLLKRCSSTCLSACAYSTSYYRAHPLELLSILTKTPILKK